MKSIKSVRIYSEEFKWQVVQEVLSGKMTKEEARKLYSIQGNCTILYWMRKFSGNDNYRNFHSFGTSLEEMSKLKKPDASIKKIEELEIRLKEANVRAALWQKMVEIAEEQLHIDIKKVWCPAIEKYKIEHSQERISYMCNLLGYSKQAYYKQLKALESDSLEVYLIVGLVKTARIIWKRGSGRNLYAYLQESFRDHQIKIGRDKFFGILREHGLLIKPKRRLTTTTLSYHRFYKYPNLIKEKVCNAPNQIWVSDITYIYLEEEQCFSYLFLITDVYSRKIIGYSLELSLKAIGAIKA